MLALPVMIISIVIACCVASCSDDEPHVRSENDILGYWTDSVGHYMCLDTGTRAYTLIVTEQEGMSIGRWEQDAYLYEPGYNFVIYIDKTFHPQIYQVIELTESKLVWCWVEDILDHYYAGESIGEILGGIIKDAQEGFKTDPADYQYFDRVSNDDFYEMLDTLDLMTPW